MTVDVVIERMPERQDPLTLACFSFRYEAHLVEELISNIRPMVHGWVSLDDRGGQERFTSELGRRRQLLDAAKRYGAEWILIVDPDERFEDRFAERISSCTSHPERPIWTVDLREMYTASAYRSDGIWGSKRRRRLFPVTVDIRVPDKELHDDPFVYDRPRKVKNAEISCYHLRMIAPARRKQRRDQYAALDPERKFQKVGYDYLTFEQHLQLTTVPLERQFSPPHFDDGLTWSSPAPLPEEIDNDPTHSRLRLYQHCFERGQRGPGAEVARLTSDEHADDLDIVLLSGFASLRAGEFQQASSALERYVRELPNDALGRAYLAQAYFMTGKEKDCSREIEKALDLAPASLLIQLMFERLSPAYKDSPSMRKMWRRWISGPAEIYVGEESGGGEEVSTVIIGHRGQAGLIAAIESILSQSIKSQVIVVNSGGGEVKTLLREYLRYIILVDIRDSHQVGTARNVGIDLSTGSIISFLAGDCIATPGWTESRLRGHKSGEVAVPSAIAPVHSATPTQLVGSAILRGSRWPSSNPMQPPGYGLSYRREIIDEVGYFPTGMGGQEDTFLNEVVYSRNPFALVSQVVTLHDDPRNPLELRRDIYQRAIKRVLWSNDWRGIDENDASRKLNDELIRSLRRPRVVLSKATSAIDIDMDRALRLIAVAAKARVKGCKVGFAAIRNAAAMAKIADAPETNSKLSRDMAEECIRTDPHHAAHYDRLARILIREEDWEGAYRTAKVAYELDPNDEKLVSLVCTCLIALERVQDAADFAESAAISRPTNLTLWNIAAKHCAIAGDQSRAVTIAQYAFVFSPGVERTNDLLVQLYRKCARRNMEKFRENTLKGLRSTRG